MHYWISTVKSSSANLLAAARLARCEGWCNCQFNSSIFHAEAPQRKEVPPNMENEHAFGITFHFSSVCLHCGIRFACNNAGGCLWKPRMKGMRCGPRKNTCVGEGKNCPQFVYLIVKGWSNIPIYCCKTIIPRQCHVVWSHTREKCNMKRLYHVRICLKLISLKPKSRCSLCCSFARMQGRCLWKPRKRRALCATCFLRWGGINFQNAYVQEEEPKSWSSSKKHACF